MKHDLHLLTTRLEQKLGRKINGKKLLRILTGKEKPSQTTLDRLALLLGFQCWDDFQEAVDGDGNGQLNYEAHLK